MIAKLFEQAKPALYLAVAVFMAVFFWYYVVVQNTISFTFTGILLSILHFGLYLVIMLLIDFIGRKNDLSKNKTYKILLFALFTTVLPETFLFEKTLLSLFFILLALRRIISLRSGIHIQKKIFDAALWISLASCFYFWSSLFLLHSTLLFLFSAETIIAIGLYPFSVWPQLLFLPIFLRCFSKMPFIHR